MQRVPKHINEAFSWPLQEVQWRLIISSSSSVDELVWAGACHDRPKTETSHPLPGFFDHQRLRAVVRHVEPDTLILTDLRNLQTKFRVMLQFNADSQVSIDDHITKSFDFLRCLTFIYLMKNYLRFNRIISDTAYLRNKNLLAWWWFKSSRKSAF